MVSSVREVGIWLLANVQNEARFDMYPAEDASLECQPQGIYPCELDTCYRSKKNVALREHSGDSAIFHLIEERSRRLIILFLFSQGGPRNC